MRRIPADEDPAVAKAIRDEPAADPVLMRDHLVGEIRSDPENGADRPVTIDGVRLLVLVEKVVHDPCLAAVDREDRAAASWIEDLAEPRRARRHAREKLRGADIGRLDPPNDRCAEQICADLLAHGRLATVAADEVIAGDGQRIAGIEIADGGDDAAFVLAKVLQPTAVTNADVRLRGSVREQDRLEKKLRAALRR